MSLRRAKIGEESRGRLGGRKGLERRARVERKGERYNRFLQANGSLSRWGELAVSKGLAQVLHREAEYVLQGELNQLWRCSMAKRRGWKGKRTLLWPSGPLCIRAWLLRKRGTSLGNADVSE